jgi:hypothetical protein
VVHIEKFPLRRFAPRAWLYSVRHRTEPASRGVTPPFRVFVRLSLAPVSVRCSPLALGFRRAPGFSRESASHATRESNTGLLSWACALLQSASKLQRPPPPRSCVRRNARPAKIAAAPPMRFAPLQRLATRGSGLEGRVCLARPPAPSGFLDLLALCSATCLPALFRAGSAHGVAPFRALLLSRGRTPSPAPVPSCRLDDPVVRASPVGRPLPAPRSPSPKQPLTKPERWPGPRTGAHRFERARGSLPAFRGLLPARVRHSPPAG